MPIRTTRDYERALSVVRDVIHEWDPYSLSAGGSPADELDAEVAELVARSRQMRCPADATHAVSEVFSRSFEVAWFVPGACAGVGDRLFAALSAAGLLPDPPTRGAV